MDKAFELIKEGNELEKNERHWEAAAKFGEAFSLLERLANDAPSSTEEEQKIAELYQTKSRHYRQTARTSLIEALQKEKEQDSQSETILVSNISIEEAENRIRTFSLLFSRASEDVGEKTSMLEERLMELNASLPSGFKTDKERLADINRGLGRLGLSLYPNSNHGSSTDIQPPLSEEDQVADIIAQAKDEVRYEKPTATGETKVSADTVSVDDSSSDLSEDSSIGKDSVSADDLVDEPIFKNRKAIRHKVVKAQVKLAELLALLSAEPEINLGDEADDKDDDNDEGIEEEGAGFDVGYGRATLVAARNYLTKALKEWPEDS